MALSAKISSGPLRGKTAKIYRKMFSGKLKSIKVCRGLFRRSIKVRSDMIDSVEVMSSQSGTSGAKIAGWGAVGLLALGPVGGALGVACSAFRKGVAVVKVTLKDGTEFQVAGRPKDMNILVGV